jgi:toxin ParE1/3/4
MRLRWTPAAADNLEAIADYLTRHFPSFATNTIREIYDTVVSLRTLPQRGRIGREEGTRELVVARLPYIVVYRIKANAVEILHIYHGAQDRP